MTPFELQRLNQALELAQAGRKADAHTLLTQLDASSPNDDNLLLWLAFTSDNLGEARTLLDRAARLNPANPSLTSAYSWLTSEEAKQPTRVGNIYSTGANVPPTASPYQAAQPNLNYATPNATTQPTYSVASQTPMGYETATLNQPQLSYQTTKAPTRKFNLLLIIGLVIAAPILLGIVIIVILVLVGPQLAEDSVVAQGLPVYSGARRLELTATDRSIVLKNFEQGFRNNSTAAVKFAYFEVYAIKSADKNQTFSFYDSALKKQNWAGTAGNPTTRGSTTQSAYQKGTTILALISGKLSASDGPLTNSRYAVTADELLLIVFGIEQSN